jgi:phosphoserine phosphatase
LHAKLTVKESAESSISSLGLDGVLYLLGYHDRHIDDGDVTINQS